mmetsp:Transcript_44833/g.116081  ORF Transcript_44833/g.116081 Transcript_44833/m.116081 type:complete len:533 (-) Transcript_44833:130-1728(-)
MGQSVACGQQCHAKIPHYDIATCDGLADCSGRPLAIGSRVRAVSSITYGTHGTMKVPLGSLGSVITVSPRLTVDWDQYPDLKHSLPTSEGLEKQLEREEPSACGQLPSSTTLVDGEELRYTHCGVRVPERQGHSKADTRGPGSGRDHFPATADPHRSPNKPGKRGPQVAWNPGSEVELERDLGELDVWLTSQPGFQRAAPLNTGAESPHAPSPVERFDAEPAADSGSAVWETFRGTLALAGLLPQAADTYEQTLTSGSPPVIQTSGFPPGAAAGSPAGEPMDEEAGGLDEYLLDGLVHEVGYLNDLEPDEKADVDLGEADPYVAGLIRRDSQLLTVGSACSLPSILEEVDEDAHTSVHSDPETLSPLSERPGGLAWVNDIHLDDQVLEQGDPQPMGRVDSLSAAAELDLSAMRARLAKALSPREPPPAETTSPATDGVDADDVVVPGDVTSPTASGNLDCSLALGLELSAQVLNAEVYKHTSSAGPGMAMAEVEESRCKAANDIVSFSPELEEIFLLPGPGGMSQHPPEPSK